MAVLDMLRRLDDNRSDRHSCSVRMIRILRLGKNSGILWNFIKLWNFTFQMNELHILISRPS